MHYRFVEPSCEYLPLTKDPKEHIVNCARICYDSQGSDYAKLYDSLVKRGHISMLRHATSYYRLPTTGIKPLDEHNKLMLWDLMRSPYIHNYWEEGYYYFAINWNYLHDNARMIYDFLQKCEEIPEGNIPPKHRRYSFKVITSIAVSRELNRVSPNNIAERSTRYVDYNRAKYNEVPILKPYWFKDENTPQEAAYLGAIENATNYYGILRDRGLPPEAARGILPLDTMTEVVYTYSYKEWKNLFEKRIRHSTGKAHPDAVIICTMIEEQLDKLVNG